MTDRHGDTAAPIDLTTFLGDDPELALVTADLNAWADAHPCPCDALCECDLAEGLDRLV